MKRPTKVAAVVIAAALAGGCASGGGGGGGGEGDGEAYACLIAGPFCPFILARDATPTATRYVPSTPERFESWSLAAASEGWQWTATGVASSAKYTSGVDGSIALQSASGVYHGGWLYFSAFGQQLADVYVHMPATVHSALPSLSGLGEPGIQVRTYYGQGPTSAFADAPGYQLLLVAEPYVLGWNYQSFGIWDRNDGTYAEFGARSFGAHTSGSMIPTSGSASFKGKLAGFYVSPEGAGSTAVADVTVAADFSSRSLAFTSSATKLTRDLKTATAAPQLNMSGTLTYAPAENSFAGTLSNAAGTMSGTSRGHFYGPAAEELGGAFLLKSATTKETFNGAYGAKR